MSESVFRKSQRGQRAYSLPKEPEAFEDFAPPSHLLREGRVGLPELSELDITRHFAELAQRTVGIDNIFYPLGSCTMKLNPRVNEVAAALPGFTRTHPLAPDEAIQGNLRLTHELIGLLCRLCGMFAGSAVPNAGSQGEFVGLQMIRRHHETHGEGQRHEILVPDNAHGTNPATAAMAGYTTVSVRTDAHGDLDLAHLKSVVSDKTAGLMLTNPNTLGLFSPKILKILEIIHGAGGLGYYDGANLNAIMGLCRPGDMGFDVIHLNLHKTFSTPHGGGGPGSGPVLCSERLAPYLPVPRVIRELDGSYTTLSRDPNSIGEIASFRGNFGIYLRAYLYIKLHGFCGLRRVSEAAVINANYLKSQIAEVLNVPYPQHCMHEFVVQADAFLDKGIKAMDIAKRLLDYGVHAPTVYFPLIIKECLLIEPTETESKATLDFFIEAIKNVVKEIQEEPKLVSEAPHKLPVTRLDEVRAAKHPKLKEGSHEYQSPSTP